MEKVVLALGAVVLVAVVLFAAVLLGTVFGALGGWVVGLFFSETMLGIFAALGIKGFAMWQIGAFLGFVGAFFKANVSTK